MADQKRTVSYRETQAIRSFLGFLQKTYRKINVNDTLLIAAISALIHVESGSFKGIKYNNPFNLRGDPYRELVIRKGKRSSVERPGRLLHFKTLEGGFRAFAKTLLNAPKGSMYNLALNALKRGGNDAAVDFLAAIAMSQIAGSYGVNDWLLAYDSNSNALLKEYLTIGGVQLRNPVAAPPPPPPPELPRDFNYKVVVRDYLDPWARGRLYDGRHRRQNLDNATRRR